MQKRHADTEHRLAYQSIRKLDFAEMSILRTNMDRSCAATIYPKLNKPSTLGLRAHCRTIRPFFRFSLASALGEMAYTCGHRLVEPSASAVYVRRRASRSVLVENGQSLFAFATRYGLFACTRCSIHAGAGLIPLTLTATISITPPQCGQRIGGLGWRCQGSGSTTRSNSCTSCSSFWLLPCSRP